ncbi:MAG: ATP-binding protein, partial [Pseudomonadota bacterium]
VTLMFGARAGALALAVLCGVYFVLFYQHEENGGERVGEIYASIDYAEVCAIACVTAFLVWSGAAVYRREMRKAAQALRAARREAEAATRAKSQFLANVSHEIRTPMNGMLGMAEILKNSGLDEREAALADMLHRSGDALLMILNDILDFSKIEAGKLELAPEPFDLKVLVGDVAELMRHGAEAKGLKLDVTIDRAVPTELLGDAGRIRQVLTNLVGNAVKFTSEGRVDIAVEPIAHPDHDHMGVRISVTDTGVGIPEDKQAAIFEEFVQAEATTTKSYGGTGLGLSIARRLTEAMDGRIGLQSTAGEGSTFWVELFLPPAEEAPPTAEAAQANAATARDSLRLHILVADDNKVNRLVVENLIGPVRAAITVAEDGDEAVARYKDADGGFDLVLMDVAMPVMDGCEAASAIRAWESERAAGRTPIIALTAHASVDKVEEICASGAMDDVLTKPVRREALERLIAKWTSGRENEKIPA